VEAKKFISIILFDAGIFVTLIKAFNLFRKNFPTIFFGTFLYACNTHPDKEPTKKVRTAIQGKTMGTRYHIFVIHERESNFDKKIIQNNIDKLLVNLNQQVSTYLPNSKINQFNNYLKTDWFQVNEDFFNIITAAQKVSKLSEGAFDITLLPIIELWGFGAKPKNSSPTGQEIKVAMNDVGFKQLTLNSKNSSIKKSKGSLRIDLSAIAKGFAVDNVSQFLNSEGFTNHLVEIGGELRVSGTNQLEKPWRIAIEQPDQNNTVANQGLEITNIAVATSGDYRNYFVEKGKRRSHIINPKTGYPIKHNLASITVLHDSTMLADAYATAILAMGEKLGKDFITAQKLQALMIIRNKDAFELWSSPNFFK